MPRFHTCPNGHRWPAATSRPTAANDPSLVCPTCGTMADTPAAVQAVPLTTKALGDQEASSTSQTFQVAASTAAAPAEQLQPHIEGYEILAEIGRGGMGIVYKARDSARDRFVAIKVIRKDRLTHAESVKRFRREAEAAARLAHPNVVRVYDSDQSGDLHYLVMEFVDGITLQRLLDQQGPLSVPDACEFARQIALGLQHVHEQALVHRDIKPANLMLTQPGGTAHGQPIRLVKILDMGVARLYQMSNSPVETLTTLTQDGAVIGTADFIAPEQLEDPHGADIRADLYSLGCTLYVLLTGQVPFPGGTLIQKLDRQRWETPPDVNQLRPEIPPAAVALVRQLMAKKPDERFKAPAELAVALEQLASAGARGTSAPLAHRAAQRLEGHRQAVCSVCFLPDGKRLLSCSQDRTCRVWDLATGEPISEFTGSWQEIRSLAVLSDGKATLVAGGASIRLVALESGRELVRYVGHTDTIRSVAASPCGTRAVSGADDRTVRVWDLQTGRELLRYSGHGASVTGVAFAPNGQQVLSGGRDQTLRLWNVGNGEDIHRFAAPRGAVLAVAVSPDGRLAASAHFDTLVRVWELDTGRELRRFQGHKQMVTAVAFTPDNQRVLTGAQDQTLRLWDVASGSELCRFEDHNAGVTCVAIDARGEWAASGSAAKTVCLWRLPHR